MIVAKHSVFNKDFKNKVFNISDLYKLCNDLIIKLETVKILYTVALVTKTKIGRAHV